MKAKQGFLAEFGGVLCADQVRFTRVIHRASTDALIGPRTCACRTVEPCATSLLNKPSIWLTPSFLPRSSSYAGTALSFLEDIVHFSLVILGVLCTLSQTIEHCAAAFSLTQRGVATSRGSTQATQLAVSRSWRHTRGIAMFQ